MDVTSGSVREQREAVQLLEGGIDVCEVAERLGAERNAAKRRGAVHLAQSIQ